MARQMLLSSMFSSISKEDMEAKVQREMVALEAQLGLEREMKEGVVKRPVGRPKKEIVPNLLPTKVNEHHHLELGRQWKVIVFHMYFVKRRVCIFKTKNLYGNDT
jgi:hypothetical protein